MEKTLSKLKHDPDTVQAVFRTMFQFMPGQTSNNIEDFTDQVTSPEGTHFLNMVLHVSEILTTNGYKPE